MENHRDGLLKISEFAKISEVSRKGLIFYDNMGVFSPEYTAPNGYRYYSHEQIYLLSVISLLKELDTPLKQIKDYMQDATPEGAIRLFREQGEKIEAKIQSLRGIQDMLQVRLEQLENGLAGSGCAIQIVEQEAAPLFLSDPFTSGKEQVPDDVWVGFYMKCREHGIAFGYPEGFMVSQKNLSTGKTNVASHIVCHVGDFKYANACMPAGTYLTARGPGSFGDTEPLYQSLLSYADENHLTLVGDGYEKRLIDEIASKDKAVQRIEVMIRVE